MLPDRSILIGQELVKSAQIQKFKCDILGDFQTLCLRSLWFEHWLLWVFFDPSNRVEREPMRLSGLPDWAQSCRSNCVGGEVFAIPEVSEHRPTSICYVDVYIEKKCILAFFINFCPISLFL